MGEGSRRASACSLASLLGCARGAAGKADPAGGLSGGGVIGDDDTTAADPDATTEGGDGTGDTTGGVDVDGDSSDASGEPDPGGESSDDSSGGDGDPEPLPPAPATCGDAAIDPGEQCDDANLDDTDDCLTTCAAASCGDGFVHDGVEACDDTINDGSYGGCMPSCADLAPYCGDDEITSGEHCEPGEQLPFANVDCTHDTCLYDFSAVPQLYCNGTCSWGGNYGCDQFDADVLCKLRTGDATSVATSFDLAYTVAAPGFSCPGFGIDLGTLPELGVNQVVWYQDFNLVQTHGNGVVVVNPTCT